MNAAWIVHELVRQVGPGMGLVGAALWVWALLAAVVTAVDLAHHIMGQLG